MAKQKLPDANQVIVRNFGPIVAIAAIFIGVGAVFYHIVEKWSWLDSLYFTVVTLSTVGYGDYVPTTPIGKIFTMFYIIIGISIFIALARALIIQIFLRRGKKGKSRLR